MKIQYMRMRGHSFAAAFLLVALSSLRASADEARYAAGMMQVEFRDPADAARPIDFLLIYPADPDRSAEPAKLPLFSNLRLFRDAPAAPGGKRPLIVFSHGAGGNASGYAWFGQYLAERGYVVAMAYHYRAHTFDSSAAYVRNRLWRRPLDLSLIITHVIEDPVWGARVDAGRVGVAGHSQGGFTALWMGGAQVNPALFEAFQRVWKSNYALPAYLRDEMEVDATPTQHVSDARVKAAFAMAPGDLPGFGMDADGLAKMRIPTYLIVGADDVATPVAENAGFAAKHIPGARLEVLPGPVGHEIFGNECDQLGRDNYPASCIDPQAIDRAKLHAHIGSVAFEFFNGIFQTTP